MAQSIEATVVRWLTGPPNKAAATRAVASADAYSPSPASSRSAAVDHEVWDRVLRRCVKPGARVAGLEDVSLFDYTAALSLEDAGAGRDLKTYCMQLARKGALDGLTDNELLCVYMNAYNAFAVEAILSFMRKHKGRPPSSINNLNTFFKSVWKRRAGVLAGKTVSLDDIEHKVGAVDTKFAQAGGLAVRAALRLPRASAASLRHGC